MAIKEKKGKEVEVIKVALPKVLRNSNRQFRGIRVDSAGEIVYDTIGADLVKKWGKEKMGDEGTMTREDYEAKNYAPYGLKEYFDKQGKLQQVDSIKLENNKLQETVLSKDEEIAELKKKLEALEKPKEVKEKKAKEVKE